MTPDVRHKRRESETPSFLRFDILLLGLTAADANNWTKANVRSGLFDWGQSATR